MVKVECIMDGHTPYQEAQAATLKSLQDMMQRIAEGDTPYQKAEDGKLDGIAADVQVLRVWRTRVVAMSGAAAALFASAVTAAGMYLKHFM
ncbi:ras-GEF domain-containing family member 1B [Micractinium conductrix]|uniref:Ras-GEF domain-containing family member 1B n=1 Tax=Micractinium conductrix TaxID=554055 RepID=A0A2P6VFA5_9CHLO|nr:ras-GEF domain-containing family member 1B [Micractinium conductrix]|eukprot:PSC72770.1 ras-GEF domain-containing family member 1B [Micractinium conductrix]